MRVSCAHSRKLYDQLMYNAPKKLSVWAIVLGAIGFVFTIQNLLLAPFFHGRRPLSVEAQIGHNATEATNHAIRLVGIEFLTLSQMTYAALALALLVIGIGLSRPQSWAPRAGVVWGVVALLYLLMTTFVYLAYWQPHYQELTRLARAQEGVPFDPLRTARGMRVSYLIVDLLGAIFPIIMIVRLRKRSGSSAFARAMTCE